jgi:hypothetical protein
LSESNYDKEAAGGIVMEMLRVISKREDDRVQWHEQDALAGDAEASASIHEAERIFAQERARGEAANCTEEGNRVERLEQFDPQDEQMILVPKVVGG